MLLVERLEVFQELRRLFTAVRKYLTGFWKILNYFENNAENDDLLCKQPPMSVPQRMSAGG